MEDFNKKVCGDVIVEVVNLTRATRNESLAFKQILDEDIQFNFKKIVIDLSMCEFMDSTFLGTLVVAQKNATRKGGEIKLIEPASVLQTLMSKAGTLKVFDTYKTLEEAVSSFNYSFSGSNLHPLQKNA
jgi:anti-anti-sigma factor